VYLIATLANDAELMPASTFALSRELPALSESAESWGIGYYADDRALIIQRPIDPSAPAPVHRVTSDLRSQVVLACAGRGDPPPYRSRRWLFASIGDLSPLEALRDTIVEKLPDFVRTDLGEGSGPALAFGMFLAELRRQGVLEDPLVTAEQARQVGTRVSDAIRGLSAEVEGDALSAAFVATNGRLVVGATLGASLHLKVQEGLEALPEGPVDPARTDFKQVAAALKRFRAVVMAHEPGSQGDWRALPEGGVVVVDGQLRVIGFDANPTV
jgi:hypothetical protein